MLARMSHMHRVGLNRDERRKPEVIHRRKLFGGRMDAEEAFARFAFPAGAKCLGCSRPPTASITTFVPVADMSKVDPLWDVWPAHHKQGLTVHFKHGPHVRWREVYACRACLPEAEKAAAKMPSWCVVEINRGPGPDKFVGGTGRS